MKMTAEHYRKFKEMIELTLNADTIENWRRVRDDIVENKLYTKDPGTRLRWTIFNAADSWLRMKFNTSRGIIDDLGLYEYLNDDHIDTALKKIVSEVGL